MRARGLAAGAGRNQRRLLSNLGGRAVFARLRPHRAIRVLADPDQRARRTAVVDRSLDVTPVAGPVTMNTVHPLGHLRSRRARGVPCARVPESEWKTGLRRRFRPACSQFSRPVGRNGSEGDPLAALHHRVPTECRRQRTPAAAAGPAVGLRRSVISVIALSAAAPPTRKMSIATPRANTPRTP